MVQMLVLAPHHDDAEFGLGGYMNRVARGATDAKETTIHVAVFCHDDYICAETNALVEGKTREVETLNALRVFGSGVSSSFRRVMRENEGYNANFAALVTDIETLIKCHRPHELFIPLKSFNQDHQVLHDAAIAATRLAAHSPSQTWAYEYMGCNWPADSRPSAGVAYLEISQQDLNMKLAALKTHGSQFGDGKKAGTPMSPSGAEVLAAFRGKEVGVPYAECVWLLREVYRIVE